MPKLQTLVLLCIALTLTCPRMPVVARADDAATIQTTITINAGQTLRAMNPRRLGGTNVAMWYSPAVIPKI